MLLYCILLKNVKYLHNEISLREENSEELQDLPERSHASQYSIVALGRTESMVISNDTL